MSSYCCPQSRQNSFYFKSDVCLKAQKDMSISDTFAINYVAKNFQKLPNLVTLLAHTSLFSWKTRATNILVHFPPERLSMMDTA